MAWGTRPPRWARWSSQRGFTLVEVMIGMLLLFSIVVLLSQAYLTALSRAGEMGRHTLGTAYLQAMIDYLRNEGYSVSGSWSETPGPCTPPKPCLPTVFNRADIWVADSTEIPGLKQIDISLYRPDQGTAFLVLSTFAADLKFP